MTIKHVYTIAPVYSFADTLAAELLKQYSENPSGLAGTVLFLPTRRACKTVQEAFLRQSNGKPLLLPRLIPFSSIEEEETQGRLSLLHATELPQAIDPLRRKLLLSKLIQKRSPQQLSAEKALHLAEALADFLDETYIEEMPFDRLKDLVPDEFAAHWQETLTFLEIVTAVWPEILKQEGVIDSTNRQVKIFKAQADFWRKNPPAFPVIAAGSTGSQPATAELLDCIASLENGKVILPGLDLLLDEESFRACEPSHPQYNLKKLLEKMKISRADVKIFGNASSPVNNERLRLISEAMRPAATTDKWLTTKKFDNTAIKGIQKVECANIQEEALSIALILRETLETPGKTAALITPDRSLARRVVAEMNRWGIVMDDSAGTNLTLTALGAFLLLLGEAALENWAPAKMLACLKHPLALGGKDFAPFRSVVRKTEITLLRGKRPGDGFDGLKHAAVNENEKEIIDFINDLEQRVGGFTQKMTDPSAQDFEALLDEHLKAAEQLAQSADKTGSERLWTQEAGKCAADFLTALKEQADLIGKLTPNEYLSLLSALFKTVTVRPKYGMHPRLDILGTIEARLIRPDVLILGGLNEGTWPKIPDADPWLSRPMREQCGLSSPERKIALSAHDFAQAFCAENLILTRSVKEGGTPSVPSRWLMRLQTVLDISGLTFEQGNWLNWVHQIDQPEAVLSFLPPHPNPPVSSRPRKLSVTKIETLMRDPYSIYAQYILGLKKLDDLDQDFSAADYGVIVHKAVEQFCLKYPDKMPVDAYDKIKETGLELFKNLNFSQTAEAFWKPRLLAALKWFVEQQEKRQSEIQKILCEQKGEMTFQTKAGPFQLYGIADRIDVKKDGSVDLIDYKTGLLPSVHSVLTGYSPQLPLEGALLRHNGFQNVGSKTPGSMEYWRLRGQQDGGTIRKITKTETDSEALTDDALEHLKDLINTYDDERTCYLATPDTSVSLQYNDFDHLARYDEWATSDSSEKTQEE